MSHLDDPDAFDRLVAELGIDENDEDAYEALRDAAADRDDDADESDTSHGAED